MEIVGVLEGPTEPCSERLADGGLARAGYPHDDDDHAALRYRSDGYRLEPGSAASEEAAPADSPPSGRAQASSARTPISSKCRRKSRGSSYTRYAPARSSSSSP